jgi:hypothetical protein
MVLTDVSTTLAVMALTGICRVEAAVLMPGFKYRESLALTHIPSAISGAVVLLKFRSIAQHFEDCHFFA